MLNDLLPPPDGRGVLRAVRSICVSGFAAALLLTFGGCARYPSTPTSSAQSLVIVTMTVLGQINPNYYYFVALQAVPQSNVNLNNASNGPFAVVAINGTNTTSWGNGWGTGKISDYGLYHVGSFQQFSVDVSNPSTYLANVAAGGVYIGPPWESSLSPDGTSITITFNVDTLGLNGMAPSATTTGSTTATTGTATTGATTATTGTTASTTATTGSTTGSTTATTSTTAATTSATTGSTTATTSATTGSTTATTSSTTGSTTATTSSTTTSSTTATTTTTGTTGATLPAAVVVNAIATNTLPSGTVITARPIDSIDIQANLPQVNLNQSKVVDIPLTGPVANTQSDTTVTAADLQLTHVEIEVQLPE